MNKTRQETDNNIVVNELTIRSVDRTKKDILTWRNALIAAESVTFPNRCRLYDLYADILLDGHLSGIIAKRMDAVLNKGLYFEHKGERIAAFDGLTATREFRKLIRAIVETQLWGVTGVEFIPGSTFAFELIPRKHIRTENQHITYEQGGIDGISYTHNAQLWVTGEPGDLGLLLKCAPYALYKRGGFADWAEYIELFGQPVRIMKYDSYDTQTRAELRQALEESGSSLSLMLPRQVDFEMVDGKQSNSDGSLQLSFIKALNEEMSIIVLGNTETTSSSYSSGYAQSKIHLEQQYEITRSDLAYVAATLNEPRFLNILSGYGYPVKQGRWTFAKELDIDYLTQRIAIDKQVAEQVHIPEAYWFNTYGISA